LQIRDRVRFSMTIYRAYLLDEKGKIFLREDVEACDDAAAIFAGWTHLKSHNGTQRQRAHGFEIWNGGRMIFVAGPGAI
jgi:hypothetical protein